MCEYKRLGSDISRQMAIRDRTQLSTTPKMSVQATVLS